MWDKKQSSEPDSLLKEIRKKEKEISPTSFRDVMMRSFASSWKVSMMLIKVYIPLSLLSILLKQSGLLDYVTPIFAPVMRLMGLPGESAIVLITGFMNLFGGLGAMAAFDLTARQLTIIAVVLGMAHGLFVETGILMKLGMATARIAFFRMLVGIGTGIAMNIFLPEEVGGVLINPYFQVTEFSWFSVARSLAVTSVQIIVVLFIVTILYELVLLWRHSAAVKNRFKFIPNAIGFSDQAFAPWVVGFFIGIAYGAGILYQAMSKSRLSHKDVCLTTVFLILAHAIVEDTMLFVVLGGNVLWIAGTRILMAFVIVRLLAIGDAYKRFLWIGLPSEK